MNYAVILSGGTGVRLGGEIPKQYIEVGNKPILMYCVETIEQTKAVDGFCIVAAPAWQKQIGEWMEQYGITKFLGFAKAGKSRQHSLLNGLQFIAERNPEAGSKVLIHDAARPNVTTELIQNCFKALQNAEGVLPVIPVKDTMYLSKDKKQISGLLNRDEIFSGQAPEAFDFTKYYEIHKDLTDDEIGAIRGTTEIGYKKGLKVNIIDGDEKNFKITTEVDLQKFREQIERTAE